MKTVTIPFPDMRLSKNSKLHWRRQLPIKKKARTDAFFLALEAIGPLLSNPPTGVEIHFYPPDHRVRDDDNVITAFKPSRDGIADAIKWDDGNWRPKYDWHEPEKPGRVEVIFT